MTEEVILPDTLAIMPNGDVLDLFLGLEHLPMGTVTIDNKSYRVVESHSSCVSKWKFVITLG